MNFFFTYIYLTNYWFIELLIAAGGFKNNKVKNKVTPAEFTCLSNNCVWHTEIITDKANNINTVIMNDQSEYG